MNEERLHNPKAQESHAADLSAEAEMEDQGEPTPCAPSDGEAEENGEVEDNGESVGELRREAAKYKDQLLRTLAEMENLRRRTQKEREDAARYAASPLVKDLLAVADNLGRALSSVSAEDRAANPALEAVVSGVEMTERGLQNVFERHNIARLDPVGEPFDPNVHEALYEIPNTESPNGTVLQVIEVGYKLHDRLLRPAKVGVSRGGPKQSAAKDGTAADGPTDESPETASGAGASQDKA